MLSLCSSQQPLALFLPPLGLLSQPHMALTHLKNSQAVKKGNSSEGVVCTRPQELHEEVHLNAQKITVRRQHSL